MNNLPQTSDIILQVFVAFLTLITSLITAYFVFKLGTTKKTKGNTNLGIIKAATSETRKYSHKIKSVGENKDLIDYIIYTLPTKVDELNADHNRTQVSQSSLASKVKFFVILNAFVLFLQAVFYISDLEPAYTILGFAIISISLCLTVALELFILIPYYRSLRAHKKKVQSFIDELNKIEGTKIINSITRNDLTEFINQHSKWGFGTSLADIKNELAMYGIKVSDSDVIRAHLNLYYSDSKQRQASLNIYFMDGKSHKSFEEISDEDILNFTEDLSKNLESLKVKENDEELLRKILHPDD